MRDWRAKAKEMTDLGSLGPRDEIIIERLLVCSDDLEHAIRKAK